MCVNILIARNRIHDAGMAPFIPHISIYIYNIYIYILYYIHHIKFSTNPMKHLICILICRDIPDIPIESHWYILYYPHHFPWILGWIAMTNGSPRLSLDKVRWNKRPFFWWWFHDLRGRRNVKHDLFFFSGQLTDYPRVNVYRKMWTT